MGILTITAEQVQDIQTTTKEILEAGTFSLYGSTPMIKIDVESLSGRNTFITLNNSDGEIIYAMNNAPIFFEDSCELIIYTRNRTNLNKLYADVLNILKTSSYNILAQNPKDQSKRDKYIKSMTIKLTDI